MLCLVSGGADSTCLLHALRELGYRVSALHVDHGLRGAESDGRRALLRRGARRRGRPRRAARAAPARPSCASSATRSAPGALRATGHTASDQVETILYRLARAARRRGSRRAARTASCGRCSALARGDRGVLPRARARVPHRLVEPRHDARADPGRDPAAARADPSGGAGEPAARRSRAPRRCRPRSPSCSTSPAGSRRVDLGGGLQAVREYDRLWLERGPVDSTAEVDWGGWRIRSRAARP